MLTTDIDVFFNQIHENWDNCLENPGGFTNDDRESHCLNPKKLLTPQEARVKFLFETGRQVLSNPQYHSDPEGFSMWEGDEYARGFNITCFPPQWDTKVVYLCHGYYNEYYRRHFKEEDGPDYSLIEYVDENFKEVFKKNGISTLIWNDNNLPLGKAYTHYQQVRLLTPKETLEVLSRPFISTIVLIALVIIGPIKLYRADFKGVPIDLRPLVKTCTKIIASWGLFLLTIYVSAKALNALTAFHHLQLTKGGYLELTNPQGEQKFEEIIMDSLTNLVTPFIR